MLGDPVVHVECDRCGEISDGLGLTLLAGPAWDMRNIDAAIKRMGWRIDGDDTHVCDNCVEFEEANCA